MSRPLSGRVVSAKTAKTVVVLVERRKLHPIYKKRYLRSKRYLVHDPDNQAKLHDLVAIMPCRPLSARKRWQLAQILERAGEPS